MDIIITAYYIDGSELMKLIFAVLDVSLTMGLTRRYKTEKFFYIYILSKKHWFIRWTLTLYVALNVITSLITTANTQIQTGAAI